jgi:hypothetical protein
MVPLAGEIWSQLPPVSVAAAAVQLMEPCPVLRMPKFCGSGTPPCATALKLNPLWESRMAAVGTPADTDRITGILMLLPAPVMVTVPL